MSTRFRWTAPLCALWILASASACGPDRQWKPSFDARSVGWLMNVAGASPTTLYAVGGAPERGVALQSNGAQWSAVTTGIDAPLLNWVRVASGSDVTVVGNGGTVLHYDGARWSRQSTPTSEHLWGVWGATSDDLWAVGGTGQFDGVPTIVHYDGAQWTSVTVPALMRTDVHALFKIWGTSASNIWVVGQRGALLHYDGRAWSAHDSGATDDLVSLWGTSADRIVAVGGRGNGVLTVFDGTSWRARSLSPLPGFNGVWMRNANIAHVVGANGALVRVDLRDFSIEQQQGPSSMDFHSVYGDSAGRLHAVGGNLALGGVNAQGVMYSRMLASDE